MAGLTAAALGGTSTSFGTRARPSLSLLPFLARPTTSSILISARNGHRDVEGHVRFRTAGGEEWSSAGAAATVEPGEFFRWSIDGLEPSTAYEYEVLAALPGGDPEPVSRGDFRTQRQGESSFTAALMTDAHTGSFVDGSEPIGVLDEVVRNVRRERPEFVLALGDNVAWSTSRNDAQDGPVLAERAYSLYRRHLAPLSMSCPHFGLIGNWEGESGKLPSDSVATVAEVRRRYTPNPDHSTYAFGGSPDEDFYAFDWGPALFVILNVQSYTTPSGGRPTPRDDVTLVEDWTLGPTQMAWFERTLEGADHPFKFVCIHHAVGGNGGSRRETLYGRGGPRAWDVGEQREVHALMGEHGVQVFFYGHDHVFVDEIVDGIHYTLPGSCGAPWKFGREITGYDRFWPDSGHARLEVQPDRATVAFIDLAGRPLHEFTVTPERP
jgi:hypothetical protein